MSIPSADEPFDDEPSEVTTPVDGVDEPATCPQCNAPCAVDDAFCESCGQDLSAAVQECWQLEVFADRESFDRVQGEGMRFPADAPVRWFTLDGPEVLVGRKSATRGTLPDIDAAATPEDVGVSHRHAVFARDEDGRWTVTDLGSTNGTFVNDGEHSIAAGQPVRLEDGDRVHMGAWTTIVVHVTRRAK
jgi:FHA domain-containing protein